MMVSILIILFGVAFILISVVVYKVKSDKKLKYFQSAETILKSEYLDNCLLNPFLHDGKAEESYEQRRMLYIESCNVKPQIEFVFDPHTQVRIGREKTCNLCLHDDTVSLSHCMIHEAGRLVYLSDFGSANGTVVRRGLFGRYHLRNTQMELKNHDRIIIGSTVMKVILFVYDSSYIS
ncbi:MAG: FHA domain-containing protein [Oscillospiraceae bacterium]